MGGNANPATRRLRQLTREELRGQGNPARRAAERQRILRGVQRQAQRARAGAGQRRRG